MTSWHSYPSVYALGHSAISELLFDDVIVEEKIDGSQFSFGRFGDELKVRSKGKVMNTGYHEKMFEPAVDAVSSAYIDLQDGWTYRGEFLAKPKHNVLAYSRIPKNHVIIFDINTGEEEYMDYGYVKLEADRIGFEAVPLLFRGKLDNMELFKELLEAESVLGGTKIEGVVIKNYNRFGKDKKALMGKYVSEQFKERHTKEWKSNNPNSGDIIQQIIMSLKTEARWNKAIQHVRESGDFNSDPRDIGNLLKEIHIDIDKECRDEIAEALIKYAMPKIKRGVCAGFPEWYKDKLMQSQFDNSGYKPSR